MSDAEDDIVQNAFFALYVNLERLDEGEKLRPFLFRVLRNQCYDELRRQGRYDVISLDDDSNDMDRTQLAVDQRPRLSNTVRRIESPTDKTIMIKHLGWFDEERVPRGRIGSNSSGSSRTGSSPPRFWGGDSWSFRSSVMCASPWEKGCSALSRY